MGELGGINAGSAMHDPGIVVPVFCLIAGVCLYAAFDYLTQPTRRRDNGTRAILTVIAFLVVGWVMVGIASYKTEDASLHAATLRWALVFPLLCQALFLWFVALLTGVRPLGVLITLTAAHLAVIAIHLVSPYGLFFSDVKSISLLQLPWGEAVVQPHATFGLWRGAVEIPTGIAVAYVFYACALQYRRGERSRAVILLLTALLVFAGNMHDLFVLGATYVAPYGFMGTMLAILLCRSRLIERPSAPADDARAASLPSPQFFGSAGAIAPLGATLLVLLLVVAARMAGSELVRNTVTLVSVVGIMVATVRVLYSVGSGKRVRRTLVLGLCACAFSLLLTLSEDLPMFNGVPLLGVDSPYNPAAQEFLLLAGILFLLSAFHFAALEAGDMRAHLVREERRFRALIDNGTDIITMVDAEGAILYASASVRRMLGYAPAAVVGRSIFDLLHPEDQQAARGALQKVLAGSGSPYRLEFRVRHRNGSWRHIEGIAQGMPDDPVLHGVIVNARDVTERRQVEERLKRIANQEQERIHRDLHDSIGQDLTGLRCLADSLARRLHAMELPEAGRADGIVEGIRRTMGDVHAALKGIAPVEPDAGGLMVALVRLVARAGEQNGTCVHLDCPEPVYVDDTPTATHLFRIAQEALTNALRHANAQNVVVAFYCQDDRIVLKVADDGIGMNGRGHDDTGGVGTRTMRDRAEAIGATLHIEPADKGGTCVSCTLARVPDRRRTRIRELE